MDLSRVIPQRWPVRLGGTTYLVPPLRLREIATLQGWLAVAEPCPLEAARPEIAAAEGEPLRVLLVDLYARCESWPIRYGSPEGAALLSTRAGALAWLSVVLARAVPTPTADELPDLVVAIEPDQWRRLAAIAFESSPLDELLRRLDPDPTPDVAEDLNWAEAFAEVAEATGWTFDQIADLTLGQWVAIRTGGKGGDATVRTNPGESVSEAAARRRRLFYGDDALHPSEVDLRRQADAEALFARFAPIGAGS